MNSLRTRTLIIAEIGVNHNGELELARKLVDAAVKAGADVAKFQVFDAASLVTASAPSAEYQIANTGHNRPQAEMLQELELSRNDFEEISAYCTDRGIEFMASGFSTDDIHFLAGLDVKRFKVPSGEITNLPYLRAIARYGKPVIVSTGMSTLDEVKGALTVFDQEGLSHTDITALHCTTDYPTAFHDVNLRAMLTLETQCGVDVGYSDHTEGFLIAPVAVGMGARVIEKHLTLDKTLPGPDHRASAGPAEFSAMVEAIRSVEESLGDGVKKPTEAEATYRLVARKSVVAKTAIAAGDILSEANVTTKRPGTGISPMEWDDVLGRMANRDYVADEVIDR